MNDSDRRVRFEVAGSNSQLNSFGVGPKQLVLIGAPPGYGKTVLGVQMIVDALGLDESLRAVIANCEMDPGTILDRQLARFAHVPYGVIRDRTYQGDRRRDVEAAADELGALRDRLAFLSPPFTMPRVRALVASQKADLVLVDYLQRFAPSGITKATDARQQIGMVMAEARELAMTGPAVIAISAMSRGGEFRESSRVGVRRGLRLRPGARRRRRRAAR